MTGTIYIFFLLAPEVSCVVSASRSALLQQMASDVCEQHGPVWSAYDALTYRVGSSTEKGKYGIHGECDRSVGVAYRVWMYVNNKAQSGVLMTHLLTTKVG